MRQHRLRALGLVCLSLCTLLVLSFWPGDSAVHAAFDETSGSLGIVSKDGSINGACPLRHTEVRGAISGLLSRVTVTQTFQNTSAQNIEAVYVFPLPESGEVDGMTIRVGGRTVRGVIKKRDEAQAIYERGKQAGQVAALLDQQRPNIFTQSVANIMPGEPVVVTISYLQTLEYQDGAYQFVFPMVVGPRYIPGQPIGKQAGGWAPDTTKVPDASQITPPVTPKGTRAGHDISIELAIDAGVPLVQMRSTSHEIEVVRTGASTAAVKLKNLAEIPNKDFVLKYDVAGEQIADAVLSQASPANSQLGPGGYFTLILQPPARLPEFDVTPKELVFLLDTSGSMRGFPIEKAKELINHALDGLYPGDTFNLITFSGDTRILFPEPVFPTVENLRQAREVLNAQHGFGGTEMMKAIRAALVPSDSQDHLRIVCFATDGLVGNDLEILGEVQKHPNARVFAYGIGNSVNRFLIESMARAGRGDAEVVTLQDDADAAAHRLYERLRAPLLTDISIDWGGLPISELYPRQLPDLFSGKPLVQTGHYAVPANGTIHIRGKRAGDDFTRDINVSLNSRPASDNMLASFWARRKIDDLMSQDLAGMQRGNVKPEIQAEIAEIGLNYNLMTQFTSFVAVEERIVTTDGKPERVEVPVEMPEGVTYEGVFGDRKNSLATPSAGLTTYAQLGMAGKTIRLSRNLGGPAAAGTASGSAAGIGSGVGSGSGGGVGGGAFRVAAPTTSLPAMAAPATVAEGSSAQPEIPKPPGEREILESKLSPALLAAFDCWKEHQSDCKLVIGGTIELELFLREDSAAVIDQLKSLGLSLWQQRTREKMIVARLPIEKLTDLAKMDVVMFAAPLGR